MEVYAKENTSGEDFPYKTGPGNIATLEIWAVIVALKIWAEKSQGEILLDSGR